MRRRCFLCLCGLLMLTVAGRATAIENDDAGKVWSFLTEREKRERKEGREKRERTKYACLEMSFYIDMYPILM